MDEELRREISRRVAEHAKELDDAKLRQANIDAIAEVYSVERDEVEAITVEVLAERESRGSPFNRVAAALKQHQLLAGLTAAGVLILIAGLAFMFTGDREAGDNLRPGEEAAVGANAPAGGLTDKRFFEAAVISNIYSSITPVRMMVTEHFMRNGSYPVKFEDIGLNRDDMRTGDHIDDMIIGKDGQIIVKADGTFEQQTYLVAYPESTMGGLNIVWRCRVNILMPGMSHCTQEDLSEYIALF